MSDPDRRIIHVPRRFVRHEWGGTEAVLAGLAAEQLASGWAPEIHTSLALSDCRSETWNGVPIRRYPYCYPFFGLDRAQRLKLDKKGGNLLSFSLLLGLLRRPGVRLFHAHTLKRAGGTVFTAARLRGKPFVVTLHGGVFDVPAEESGDLLDAQRGALEWGKPFGLLLRSRRLLHKADAVICLGGAEFAGAQRALGHERIYRLGNGVHVERFAQGDGQGFRARHGIPPDALVAACYSRFDPQKDQLGLLEAFDRLAGEFPTFHLVLAGPSTVPEYLAAIDRRIAASPFAARVRRLPAIDSAGSDLADAYHGCDIFALPSRHEPFGIVVLEAWSAGKPVVACAVGGLRDLVADGDTGLLVAPGDPAALAEGLRRLLISSDLRERLGGAGRDLARRQYSWARIAGETERIYEAAAAHARAGARPNALRHANPA
jgi:glycosyltransferase involved in cell wall biosynthesis